MKNRVKGLLALCLAMCMVLAMTTVAFGATTVYYGDISDTVWKTMQAGDMITTVENSGCGRSSFFVVKEDGTYWAEMNTETNGAHGVAYTDANGANSAVPYFTNWYSPTEPSGLDHDIFTLPTMAGYNYEVKKSTGSGSQLYIININNNSSQTEIISNRLMVKPVAKSGFTVKYDLNGGTGSIADKAVKWTDTVLPGSEPTKDGHVFVGWEYAKEGNTAVRVTTTTAYKDLAGSDSVMSITLTAVWEVLPDDETPTTPTPTHQHTRRQPATTTVETPSTTVASPKTFDAGVAVYGVMAALSLTGTAAIIGKKKKF